MAYLVINVNTISPLSLGLLAKIIGSD